jgi:hypothetical protein
MTTSSKAYIYLIVNKIPHVLLLFSKLSSIQHANEGQLLVMEGLISHNSGSGRMFEIIESAICKNVKILKHGQDYCTASTNLDAGELS